MIPEGRSPQGIVGLVTLTSSNPYLAVQPAAHRTQICPLSKLEIRESGRAVTGYHRDDRIVSTHHATALATCLVVTLSRFRFSQLDLAILND
jgi:hypothetical protein